MALRNIVTGEWIIVNDNGELGESVGVEDNFALSASMEKDQKRDDMIRHTRITLCSCLLGLVAGCTGTTPSNSIHPHRMTQVSVINALMIGRYDGVMSIPELLRQGNFGIGTLDHLDGEMIVLDGRIYQVRGDGVVSSVGNDRSTPFAVVTNFDADGEFPCPIVASLTDLDSKLGEALPQKNNFVAIRIDGRFASITLRSVHRQEPPYRPLAEVAEDQSVWTHQEVAGTVVGIRCPAWVVGLNVPGYHWHFLSDDRKVGGHVLDCRVWEGRVRYDVCRDWEVKLDTSEEFNRADLSRNLSRELHRVESSRGRDAADGGGAEGRDR